MCMLLRMQVRLQPMLPCGAVRAQSWCARLAQGDEGAAGGARQQCTGHCDVRAPIGLCIRRAAARVLCRRRGCAAHGPRSAGAVARRELEADMGRDRACASPLCYSAAALAHALHVLACPLYAPCMHAHIVKTLLAAYVTVTHPVGRAI